MGDGHEAPILLGEAPSRSGDRYWEFPLSGAVAERLCELAGIDPLEGESRYGRWTWALYERFECLNLIERWPGAQGSGAAFPMPLAREALLGRLPEIEGRVVVLLGARLRSLVMPECSEFYRWETWPITASRPDGTYVVSQMTSMVAIPHPSGLNRMYNAEAEKIRAGVVLRQAVDYARSSTTSC